MTFYRALYNVFAAYLNPSHRYFPFFYVTVGIASLSKSFTVGNIWLPLIHRYPQLAFILVMVSLVALQSVFNLFSDWKLEPVKHSATDDIEDEIETLKRNVGSN